MKTFKKHVENLDLPHHRARDKFINIYNEYLVSMVLIIELSDFFTFTRGPSSPQHSASSSPSNSPTPEPSVPNKKASTSQSARAGKVEKAKEAAKAAKIRSGVQAGPSKSKK